MPAGPGPEFPLWLGLISLPLAFLGDLCWFPLLSGLRATKERHTTVHRGEGVGREKSLWARVLRTACHAHGLALYQTAITSKRSAPPRWPLELYNLHDRQCYFRPHLLSESAISDWKCVCPHTFHPSSRHPGSLLLSLSPQALKPACNLQETI